MAPLASPTTHKGTNTNVVMTKKSHVAPQFDLLDLSNAMVPLTIASSSCDADANTSPSHHEKVTFHLILNI